ncbi:hypothetical protein Brsp07_04566 [Brucella sp. NBRC 14130]|uniref:hypothetical protein n=1 Tax=Brucella sp. NBRC 14130 TaxID=3075483 RepID=UPI0030ADB58A
MGFATPTTPFSSWTPLDQAHTSVIDGLGHPPLAVAILRLWGTSAGEHVDGPVSFAVDPDDASVTASFTTSEDDPAEIRLTAEAMILRIGGFEDDPVIISVPAGEIFELGAFDDWFQILPRP